MFGNFSIFFACFDVLSSDFSSSDSFSSLIALTTVATATSVHIVGSLTSELPSINSLALQRLPY